MELVTQFRSQKNTTVKVDDGQGESFQIIFLPWEGEWSWYYDFLLELLHIKQLSNVGISFFPGLFVGPTDYLSKALLWPLEGHCKFYGSRAQGMLREIYSPTWGYIGII